MYNVVIIVMENCDTDKAIFREIKKYSESKQ